MDVQEIAFESQGTTLTVPLVRPAAGDGARLMILLPGRGYTIDAPLLYYARHLGWNLGYDTLLVSYSFQLQHSDFSMAEMPRIHAETRQVIRTAVADRAYTEVVIVGKSLGTPLAASLVGESPSVSHLILMTPIQASHTMAPQTPTLALIGTADPAYDPAQAVASGLLTWRVFEGLNHAMVKPGDLAASTRALAEIMQACEDFLSLPRP